MLIDIHEVKSKSSILSCRGHGSHKFAGWVFCTWFYGRGILSFIVISGVIQQIDFTGKGLSHHWVN